MPYKPHEIFKVFTRSNSLLIFQVWHKSETKLIKKWINWSAHTFILHSKEGLTEVYFDQKDLNVNANRAIAEKLKDKTFLPKLFNHYKEKLKILEKIWKQDKALKTKKELIALFNFAANTWSGLALAYQIPIMPKGFATKEQIKEALKMRRESDDFFISLDKIFLKSLKKLFPKLGKLVKFIAIEEIKKNKIPNKSILKKRSKGFIFYQGKIFTTITFDQFLKKHNFKLTGTIHKKKPKWIILQKRGEREHFPIMPAVLSLFEVLTDPKLKKAIGAKEKSVILEWHCERNQNYAVWYGREDQWDKFCQRCYQILLKKPDHQNRLAKKFKKRVPKFLQFCQRVYVADLKKKSNPKLWEFYKKYVSLYKNLYTWGEIFGFAARFPLSKYLTSYLQNKTKNPERTDAYFSTLITPSEKPFLLREEIALLKIAQKIWPMPKLKILLRQKSFDPKKFEEYPQINKLILKHTKKYQWIPYDYGGKLFQKKHFISELQKIIQAGNPNIKLKKISQKYKDLPRQKKQIISKLNIDQKHQELFRALAVNNFIIDFKKEVFTRSHFLINRSLLKEIARRLKIPQRHAHSYLAREMKRCLVNAKCLPIKILEERFKHTVGWGEHGKSKIMTGKEAKAFIKKHGIGMEKKKKPNIIRGQVANRGIVQGRVKIITGPTQFPKMQNGDILVTHMTTPEFVPIIKKASAIITDEGGITCHAAIISRELNIPCVIGTKIATEVLKDGDFVKLNANQGVAKIINP